MYWSTIAMGAGRVVSSGINRGASASEAGAGTSRHLVFSPDSTAGGGGRRRHTGTPPRHTTQQQLQFPARDTGSSAAAIGRPGHSQAPMPTITDLSSPATKSDAQDELLMILDKVRSVVASVPRCIVLRSSMAGYLSLYDLDRREVLITGRQRPARHESAATHASDCDAPASRPDCT